MLSGVIAGGNAVPITQGPALCEFAAGVCLAEQQVGRRLGAGFPGQAEIQDAFHFVRPGQLHRAAAAQNNDRARIDRGDTLDQLVIAGGQLHIVTVKALRFDAVGKACKHDDRAGLFCRLFSRLQQLFIPAAIRQAARQNGNIGTDF